MSVRVIVYAIGAAQAQAQLLALAPWRRTVDPQGNRVLSAWLAIVGAGLAVKALTCLRRGRACSAVGDAVGGAVSNP
jgi:hypothetical protein